eukprot:CAMPEP_0196735390 /NCGR_PEP_ID=MMETSP1091-20130531/13855_1 /TAXON_ID=302021 /ORGANISM="Rhodomonas sp., Strain CCMP768" /LENGTH=108 /DNA_ID=CAMNT_0042079027 /DNA_START=230 /DNA_END=557 /DNA_ORIENTATION=+
MALDFHHSVCYPKVTKVILYPPCGFYPAPIAEELAENEKALKDAGGGSPNIADLVHIDYTRIACPESCVAKHAALMAYTDAVKAKLPKWQHWSGPADGFSAGIAKKSA